MTKSFNFSNFDNLTLLDAPYRLMVKDMERVSTNHYAGMVKGVRVEWVLTMNEMGRQNLALKVAERWVHTIEVKDVADYSASVINSADLAAAMKRILDVYHAQQNKRIEARQLEVNEAMQLLELTS